MRLRPLFAATAAVLSCTLLSAAFGAGGSWRQVHPYWRDAYVLSFRSPDLLSQDPDERWGENDARLVCGDVLHDFPAWLSDHQPELENALADGRPVLLSLLLHSGYGTGLVTYSDDLKRAQVANYPWLVRQLLQHGLSSPQVTVAVDTCNSQAAAAHQLRPDLFPHGPDDWQPFQQWRAADRARKKLSQPTAYRVFAQDRLASHLAGSARGQRSHVEAAPFVPLTREERMAFRGHLYGQRGVIWGTPAFFNLLRLGPNPRGTLTGNLLTDRLDGRVLDSFLAQNKAEFRRFREFGFLAEAGGDADAAKATRTAAVQKPKGAGSVPALSGHEPAPTPGD